MEPDNKAAASLLHRRRRKALVVFASLSTFFYVGAFFGWGPMQLLLEENGAFDWKCSEATTNVTSSTIENSSSREICPSQTNALINVQFLAQVSQILAPLLGLLADRYGARINAYLMTSCMLLGLASLVLAAQYRWDRLLYVTFILIGLGTWNGGLLTVQTALFYTSPLIRRQIIVALNSLFDAGSVTYLLLWKLSEVLFSSSQKQSQHALTKISTGYFVVSVLIFGSLAYLWTVTDREPEESVLKDDSVEPPPTATESTPETNAIPSDTVHSEIPNEGSTSAAISTKVQPEASLNNLTLSESGAGFGQESTEDNMNSHGDTCGEIDENGLESGPEAIDAALGASVATPTPPMTTPTVNYIRIAERAPFQQLTSGPALLLAMFFSIHVTANQWAITTTRDFLAYLGDDELDNKYLTIFTLLMPASLLALPMVNITLAQFGFSGGFSAINILAIGYSVIRVASENLNVQVLGFIIFAFYRCFLFGVVMSFLPVLLGHSVTGKATGFLYMFAGFTSLINLPMANLATQHFHGDFFWPNLVYILLILPCIAAAWGLRRAVQREKAVLVSG